MLNPHETMSIVLGLLWIVIGVKRMIKIPESKF